MPLQLLLLLLQPERLSLCSFFFIGRHWNVDIGTGANTTTTSIGHSFCSLSLFSYRLQRT
jgi:hypothetical protein